MSKFTNNSICVRFSLPIAGKEYHYIANVRREDISMSTFAKAPKSTDVEQVFSFGARFYVSVFRDAFDGVQHRKDKDGNIREIAMHYSPRLVHAFSIEGGEALTLFKAIRKGESVTSLIDLPVDTRLLRKIVRDNTSALFASRRANAIASKASDWGVKKFTRMQGYIK